MSTFQCAKCDLHFSVPHDRKEAVSICPACGESKPVQHVKLSKVAQSGRV